MIHVALLRGINVGGRNRLPMKDLAAMFADAGCRDVQTYIQSGNVVFDASPTLARRVPALVGSAVAGEFGFRPAIVMRTADELKRVVHANPFLADGADPATLHVAFLLDAPGARARQLDPARSPPDAFAIRGREIYLCYPNGLGRSKLTGDYLEAQLATTTTIRNWRTVLELIARCRGTT